MGSVDTASAPDLSVKDKVAYTSGIFLTGPGLHAVNVLALPVYNVLLGVSPAYVGYALACFRVWDAVIDPVVGYFADLLSSRWGRRKPPMIVGAVLCALIFPLVWWASPTWGIGSTIAYFVALNLLYFTALAIYAVPYEALGYELTADYDQRASLYSVRGWAMIIGFVGLPWIFPLAQSDWFSSPLQGIRTVTLVVGLFFLVTALVPVLFLTERRRDPVRADAQPRVASKRDFLACITGTFRNSMYRQLVVTSCVVVIGGATVSSLSLYINIYYVFGGDVKKGSVFDSSINTGAILLTLVALPFLPRVSRQMGKAGAVMLCIALELVGSALKWFCYTRSHPWLELIPIACVTMGNFGYWSLLPSMVADACDYDEFVTGRRHEGMYASVTQWICKLGYSLANVLSGLLLVWIGFSAGRGGAQSMATLFWMRILFVTIPACAFVSGMVLLWRYPLTRDRLHDIRLELERRRRVALTQDEGCPPGRVRL